MSTTRALPPQRPLPPGHGQVLRRVLVSEVAGAIPGRRSGTSRFARPALAAAAVVAVAAVTVNVTSRASAFASWSPVPDQLTGAPLDAAGSACHRQLDAHFPGQVRGLSVALAESRGSFGAVLLATGPKVALCMTGLPHGELGGVLDLAPVSTTDRLTVEAQPGLLTGDGAVREAFGRVLDPDVSKVVIVTSDGRRVTASVANGLYLGWWPSGADPADVTGYNAGGAAVVTVHGRPTEAAPS